MKLLWVHKILLDQIKDDPRGSYRYPSDGLFYGSFEELQELFQKEGWIPFFTMGD